MKKKNVLFGLMILLFVLLSLSAQATINKTTLCDLMGLNLNLTVDWQRCESEWENLTSGVITQIVYVNITKNITIEKNNTQIIYVQNTTEKVIINNQTTPTQTISDDETKNLLKTLIQTTNNSNQPNQVTSAVVGGEEEKPLTAEEIQEMIRLQQLTNQNTQEEQEFYEAKRGEVNNRGGFFSSGWFVIIVFLVVVGLVVVIILNRKKIISEIRGKDKDPPKDVPELRDEAELQKALIENDQLKKKIKNAGNKNKSKPRKKTDRANQEGE